MSEHLTKARQALEAAQAATVDSDLSKDPKLPIEYERLLKIAQVQAQLAQAEALQQIADAYKLGGPLDRIVNELKHIYKYGLDVHQAEY